MIGRTLTMARKELLHIIRDRRTLAVMFLIPVVQLFLLGYAATTDIKHLPTAVLDRDRTPESRELIATYQASNYFDLTSFVDDEAQLGRLLDWGQVRAGLMIPAGYGQDISAGRKANVAFLIDGSDPNVAATVFAASQQVGQSQNMRLIERRLGISADEMMTLEVRPRVWYNPDMKSVNFMVPALMGLILFFITMLLTAMSIVRERERGTIEQLMVTPVQPLEIIVGKVLPYVAVAFFDVLEVLAIGVLWFGVPIHGSVWLLLGMSSIFLMSSLGLGIFISSVSNTQQEAMMLAFFVLMPSMFLAGFFFPIEAMPKFLQWLSYLVPLRYMLIIIRGIILKGVGWQILAGQAGALLLFGASIMLFAAARFKKRLE
jgi:ABC-2 type transport system permease protein